MSVRLGIGVGLSEYTGDFLYPQSERHTLPPPLDGKSPLILQLSVEKITGCDGYIRRLIAEKTCFSGKAV